MSPLPLEPRLPDGKPSHPNSLVLEAWAQGYMVGSLVIMAAITVANMRPGVILHKLILLELVMGMFHGTFIFANPPAYGWYLSATAIPLNMSWSLHNVIAWMKTKPFLTRRWSLFYITTVILVQPYWVLEIYANFTYFNNINNIFRYTRPYEALFRDPWWVFTAINLFYNIVTRYNMSLLTVIRVSPRFGVLLTALTLSICFIVVDICAVTGVFDTILPDGLNPFWKLAFVFKCLTDSIVLDDFKTALDRLMRHKLQREAASSPSWGFVNMNADTAVQSRFQEDDDDDDAAALRGCESRAQARAGQDAEMWRIHSIGTAPGEDPLGDDSVDRQRNRSAAEPSSPVDLAHKRASARATALHSGTGTPARPRSRDDMGSAAGRPTSEEGREWQRKEWQSVTPVHETAHTAAGGGGGGGDGGEGSSSSSSDNGTRPANASSRRARTAAPVETWDAVDLPPWPKTHGGNGPG